MDNRLRHLGMAQSCGPSIAEPGLGHSIHQNSIGQAFHMPGSIQGLDVQEGVADANPACAVAD